MTMEEFKPRDYIEMETETNMDRADGLADELEGLTAAVNQCKDLDFLLPRFEKALDAANTLQGIMDDLYMDVCDAVMEAEEDDRND